MTALDEKALEAACKEAGNAFWIDDEPLSEVVARALTAYLTALPQSPVGELVKRLSAAHDAIKRHAGPSPVIDEAATALLALQAENERLKDELKNARLMG